MSDNSVPLADDVVAQRLKDAGKLGPHYPVHPADTVSMTDDVRTGVYGNVPDALGAPLTPAEVEALAQGTEVIIIWSGGNGPHHYWIFRSGNLVYARSGSWPEEDFTRHLGWEDPITFVGSQRFHTRVWLTRSDGPGGGDASS